MNKKKNIPRSKFIWSSVHAGKMLFHLMYFERSMKEPINGVVLECDISIFWVWNEGCNLSLIYLFFLNLMFNVDKTLKWVEYFQTILY